MGTERLVTGKRAEYAVREDWSVGGVVELFRSIRGTDEAAERFQWLYEQNPSGRALVWTLYSGDEPVGFTAAFPRNIWVRGERRRALVCGDFSIDTSHRTLGPALLLRRPAKARVDAGEYDLLYAHPMPAMLPVHTRIGHPQLSTMTRWTLPLRTGLLLEARIGARWAGAIAPVGDLALACRRTLQRLRGSRNVEVCIATDVGSEFDGLDFELGKSYAVIGDRSRAHLSWRFLQNPKLRPVLLEARTRGGNLIGYLIMDTAVPVAHIHDLAFIPTSGAGSALLARAARIAAGVEASSLTFFTPNEFPGEDLLLGLGFLRRLENQPVVAYGGSGFEDKHLVEDASKWYMTVGDRDI